MQKKIELTDMLYRFLTGTYLNLLRRERRCWFESGKGYSQILAPSWSSITTPLQEVTITSNFFLFLTVLSILVLTKPDDKHNMTRI